MCIEMQPKANENKKKNMKTGVANDREAADERCEGAASFKSASCSVASNPPGSSASVVSKPKISGLSVSVIFDFAGG